MTTCRNSLLGTAMAGAIGAALLCGASLAQAQDYRDPGYQGQNYYGGQHYYDSRDEERVTERVTETVIVHPYYGVVEQRQQLGRVDGEINPSIMTLSQPVRYSDMDLASHSGFARLRDRIADTAEDVCAELDRRSLTSDRDANRECVRSAMKDAMRQVADNQ